MILAIIPAKKNSKRLKNKNIKKFNGIPIIAHSIKLARKSNIFNEIHVSTDSKKIKEIAIKYGAKVPFLRNKKLTQDNSILIDVIKDHINNLKNNKIKYICMIFATTPLLKSSFLVKSFKKFKKIKKALYCISCVEYEHSILESFYLKNNNFVKTNFKKKFSRNTQNLKKNYYESGQFVWFKIKAIRDNKKIFSNENTIAYVIPRIYVQDIDTKTDWDILKLKNEFLKKL